MALIATITFSWMFYIIYIYCGISDMLDGFVARKSKNTSKLGAILDSMADIVFVVIAMIKILPVINLSNAIILWAIIIAIVKVTNVICSYIYYKKLVFPHTIANKITGLVLFVSPLMLFNNNSILFEIIICSIATFSAIQEGHYIRIGKEERK